MFGEPSQKPTVLLLQLYIAGRPYFLLEKDVTCLFKILPLSSIAGWSASLRTQNQPQHWTFQGGALGGRWKIWASWIMTICRRRHPGNLEKLSKDTSGCSSRDFSLSIAHTYIAGLLLEQVGETSEVLAFYSHHPGNSNWQG